jgi:hypothetical protein
LKPAAWPEIALKRVGFPYSQVTRMKILISAKACNPYLGSENNCSWSGQCRRPQNV